MVVSDFLCGQPGESKPWQLASGHSGPAIPGVAAGAVLPFLQSLENRLVLAQGILAPSVVLGASSFDAISAQQTAGPAGYLPIQIQTAYGLSTGTAYNNNISFGSVTGNGAGQTIGIFEEGYNPAFVSTYLNGNPSRWREPRV